MTPEHIQDDAAEWSGGPLKTAMAHFPERSKSFATTSGLRVERLYLPDQDVIDNYRDRLGFPGSYPFTRGAHPTMYRSRIWTMREYAGYSTAQETNRRNRYLLSQGSTGLSIAFDLPTQIGLDSDHPLCVGEVGKVGVAINTLADMEALFDGIPLEEVSTSMTINAPAAVLLAMYVAVAEKQGVDPAKAARHDPERHPQRIHRARHVHLSARGRACDSSRTRSSTARNPSPLELDLDQRLSHSRGRRDRRARTGIHARRCDLLHRDGHQGRAAHR